MEHKSAEPQAGGAGAAAGGAGAAADKKAIPAWMIPRPWRPNVADIGHKTLKERLAHAAEVRATHPAYKKDASSSDDAK